MSTNRLHLSDQLINSWRVAHQNLSLGAALMFSVAAVLPMVAKTEPLAWAVSLCLIVSSYAFCEATPLAAITKDRGLATGAKGLARLVYLGNMVGALSSLVEVFIFSAGVSL
jgi:hypothetical protein